MECEGCSLTNVDFTVICNKDEDVLEFLMRHGVILRRFLCEICNSECTIDFNRHEYRCQRSISINKKKKAKHCFERSIFQGTFFDNCHMNSKIVCLFVMIWLSRDPPRQQFIQKELGLNPKTIVDWSSFCREVLIDWVSKSEGKIGGEGEIVEIDEANIGKRKYNRGKYVEGQWVFGGILRSDPSKVFVVPVETRDATNLLKVIKDKILPGTTILSDCWKAYDCLQKEGFINLIVNHSINFVDPATGARTQNIERTWREVRAKVSRYGRKKDHYVGYLAEFMFKRAFKDHRERIHHFFAAVGTLYSPQ